MSAFDPKRTLGRKVLGFKPCIRCVFQGAHEGKATIRCGSVRTIRQLASLQNGQFRKEGTWLTNRITVCNALIATVQHKHGASKNSERERKNLLNGKPNVQ